MTSHNKQHDINGSTQNVYLQYFQVRQSLKDTGIQFRNVVIRQVSEKRKEGILRSALYLNWLAHLYYMGEIDESGDDDYLMNATRRKSTTRT